MANFRNKSGFSLLEIIIAMGLATGLLIFYMKMQGEAAKNAKTASVNKEVETFTNDFKAIIDRPGFCDKSFENVTLADNSTQTITEIKNPRGDVRYAVGTIYNTNSVKLNGITLKNFRPDDKEGFEGIATLEINLERIGKIYGAKTIMKTMEVSVSRDKSHKILACGALGSSGGGLNINITAPAAASSTTPANNPNAEIPNSQTKPVSPSTTPVTTPSATPSTDEGKNQEAILKELQSSPQMKEMQEALKTLQKQNANGDVDID